ncbi:uncharacterized protein LOC129718225 [Wyeomyia smithii]|uniref:uncharacterized protein LOC129718225 n=1 Tax=Wyeomyia smithii TaxID=174621 RepID=UPI002467D26D|nr:uncharacterized protein LOC129718225 [Wyeomyia smithii]
MEHLSILTAGWSYIPAGLTFGYMLMVPILNQTRNDQTETEQNKTIYDETEYWPFIVAIITLIISVALTNGLKLNYRKCQFVHLYLQLAAMAFYLCAGLIFLLVEGISGIVPTMYLAACGMGLTLIPGLSYIHIRAPARWRPLYMSLCYFWFLAGVGGTATIFRIETEDDVIFPICLLSSTACVIVMIALVEMLQREGIVNYKKPLDFDTDIAHESGKLMGDRQGSVNLYNNFSSAGVATLSNGGALPKQWNSSTEQIIAGSADTNQRNFRKLWVFYMIFTKLQGLIAFYWIFLHVSAYYSQLLFDENTEYVFFWFLVLGSLIGTLCMVFLSAKIVFLGASVLHTIGLILAVSFLYTGVGDVHVGVSMLVFYTFIGASLVIPAINILELSPLNFNESFLAMGTILELLGIALIQYYSVTNREFYPPQKLTKTAIEVHGDVIAAHFIAMIVLSVILQVIVLWHMPTTFKKSLPEIKSDLARMTSYFAFARMMVPVSSNHQPMTRAYEESIASERPEVDEKQLSTRNGHLAVAASHYNERSDDSTGRGSPYNDFSESRYSRRQVVDQDFSASPDRDDPYLQEQLQRQHERNYILSRQQQYRQQARESPESQPYNYRAERRSENHYQQRAFNPPLDDYSPERPLSRSSQINHRPGPPLLARQQYYEQYSQERPQPPLPKPSPIRQSPAPSTTNEPVVPMLVRRPPPSQTVKSEPGSVIRPRLQTQKSEAPAPPPLPPADYLTKSLPRIRPDRQTRESIHPVLIPKPAKQREEIVPGVEYTSNLRPSEFLRQNRQSMFFRESTAVPDFD